MGTIPGRVGSARLTCDYNAISVQLQLQLPTGTELGNYVNYEKYEKQEKYEEYEKYKTTQSAKIYIAQQQYSCLYVYQCTVFC